MLSVRMYVCFGVCSGTQCAAYLRLCNRACMRPCMYVLYVCNVMRAFCGGRRVSMYAMRVGADVLVCVLYACLSVCVHACVHACIACMHACMYVYAGYVIQCAHKLTYVHVQA